MDTRCTTSATRLCSVATTIYIICWWLARRVARAFWLNGLLPTLRLGSIRAYLCSACGTASTSVLTCLRWAIGGTWYTANFMMHCVVCSISRVVHSTNLRLAHRTMPVFGPIRTRVFLTDVACMPPRLHRMAQTDTSGDGAPHARARIIPRLWSGLATLLHTSLFSTKTVLLPWVRCLV